MVFRMVLLGCYLVNYIDNIDLARQIDILSLVVFWLIERKPKQILVWLRQKTIMPNINVTGISSDFLSLS